MVTADELIDRKVIDRKDHNRRATKILIECLEEVEKLIGKPRNSIIIALRNKKWPVDDLPFHYLLAAENWLRLKQLPVVCGNLKAAIKSVTQKEMEHDVIKLFKEMDAHPKEVRLQSLEKTTSLKQEVEVFDKLATYLPLLQRKEYIVMRTERFPNQQIPENLKDFAPSENLMDFAPSARVHDWFNVDILQKVSVRARVFFENSLVKFKSQDEVIDFLDKAFYQDGSSSLPALCISDYQHYVTWRDQYPELSRMPNKFRKMTAEGYYKRMRKDIFDSFCDELQVSLAFHLTKSTLDHERIHCIREQMTFNEVKVMDEWLVQDSNMFTIHMRLQFKIEPRDQNTYSAKYLLDYVEELLKNPDILEPKSGGHTHHAELCSNVMGRYLVRFKEWLDSRGKKSSSIFLQQYAKYPGHRIIRTPVDDNGYEDHQRLLCLNDVNVGFQMMWENEKVDVTGRHSLCTLNEDEFDEALATLEYQASFLPYEYKRRYITWKENNGFKLRDRWFNRHPEYLVSSTKCTAEYVRPIPADSFEKMSSILRGAIDDTICQSTTLKCLGETALCTETLLDLDKCVLKNSQSLKDVYLYVEWRETKGTLPVQLGKIVKKEYLKHMPEDVFLQFNDEAQVSFAVIMLDVELEDFAKLDIKLTKEERTLYELWKQEKFSKEVTTDNQDIINGGACGFVSAAVIPGVRNCAVKKVNHPEEDSEENSTRKEYELLLACAHQSRGTIVTPLALLLEADGYIVGYLMELCDKSLTTVIFGTVDHTMEYSIKDALDWFVQCCCGVEYIHRQGIIHGDIKPDNILFRDGMLKICDFDVARSHKESTIALKNCGTNVVQTIGIGTRGYMAPELCGFEEEGEYGAKIDIYSLGVVFWNMFTRRCVPASKTFFTEIDVSLIEHFTIRAAAEQMLSKERNTDIALCLQRIDSWATLRNNMLSEGALGRKLAEFEIIDDKPYDYKELKNIIMIRSSEVGLQRIVLHSYLADDFMRSLDDQYNQYVFGHDSMENVAALWEKNRGYILKFLETRNNPVAIPNNQDHLLSLVRSCSQTNTRRYVAHEGDQIIIP